MEPFAHFLLAVLILLAVFPKIKKEYLILSLLVFIPDLDVFLLSGTYHRMLFHNLFFVAIITTSMYFIWNKRAYFLSVYFLLSHLMLDMLSKPGVGILYPAWDKLIYFVTEITRTNGEWAIDVGIRTFTHQQYLAMFPVVSYYYSTLITMLGLLILMAVLIKIKLKQNL